MNPAVRTSDMYEAVYYLAGGCSLVEIEPRLMNNAISCDMVIQGENLLELQQNYFQCNANLNLHEFRRKYGQLNAQLHTVKKMFKEKLKAAKQARQQGGQA